MRISAIAAAGIIAASFAFAMPASAAILITVDKSAQRLTVAVDGETKWEWPVSTGATGYSTPSGDYKAFRMEADHFSKEFDDAPMPHSIFFTQEGHAIHGTYQSKRLGQAVSHGCVRLSAANATKLYALVKAQGLRNTQVVIEGETPGGESEAMRNSVGSGLSIMAEEKPFGPGIGWDRPRSRTYGGARYDSAPPAGSIFSPGWR